MTPETIIEGLQADGVRLTLLQGYKIKAIGNQCVVYRWLPIIRDHKPGLVAVLQRAEGEIVIEPTSRDAKAVYWERANGRIYGPVCPEFMVKVGSGPSATFWVISTYQGQIIWIRSDRLRSQQAFQSRTKPNVCPCCRSDRFWESVHGATVCATCHPPADPALVVQ